MVSFEFEPTISAGERPQTYALDRAAIGRAHFTGVFLLSQKLVLIVVITPEAIN